MSEPRCTRQPCPNQAQIILTIGGQGASPLCLSHADEVMKAGAVLETDAGGDGDAGWKRYLADTAYLRKDQGHV